jgi:hypothetical protein
MGDLRNEFAWSKSRSRKFADCRRLYWFDVYGKWGGWDVAADPRIRELYVLSHLKNRHMWVGDVVHIGVATILRAYRDGELIDPEQIVSGLRERMRQDFRDSRAQKFRQAGHVKCCALREHEYKEDISKEDWERVASKAEACLRNFIASEVFAELKQVRTADWLAIDESKPSAFSLKGIKVWVKIDAAYRSEKGIHIIDWKTGNSEDELGPLQLAVYALYAKGEWLAGRGGAIQVSLCDLSSNPALLSEEAIEPADLEDACKQILADSEAMAALLSSSREQNVALEERYPGTEVPRTCRGCNFHKVCPVTPLSIS